MATWEDSDSESSSDDEEVANICLMADVEDEVTILTEVSSEPSSSFSDDEDEEDLSFEDLLNNCNTLSDQYFQLKQKFKSLKANFEKLKLERDEAIEKVHVLE